MATVRPLTLVTPRVYDYPLEPYGSRYIMLYSGFIDERGIRCVWLAHSKDGAT